VTNILSDKEVECFVISVRRRALADQEFSAPTHKQVIRLIIQMENALVHRKNRVRVLAAITGLPLRSQNDLTFHYHSVLIDETVDGRADGILGRIESAVTEYPVEQAYRLLPWDAPTNVSVLQETDQEGSEI
jgi:hypothetical protein